MKLNFLIITRIALLISLIILLISLNTIPITDCHVCRFKIGEDNMKVDKFINIYFDKCIFPFKNPSFQFINFSEVNRIGTK